MKGKTDELHSSCIVDAGEKPPPMTSGPVRGFLYLSHQVHRISTARGAISRTVMISNHMVSPGLDKLLALCYTNTQEE